MKLSQCKNHGMKIGLLTIPLVIGVGYPVLKLPAVSRLVPQKYKPLTICGTALIVGYLATAYTTRRCIHNLQIKRE